MRHSHCLAAVVTFFLVCAAPVPGGPAAAAETAPAAASTVTAIAAKRAELAGAIGELERDLPSGEADSAAGADDASPHHEAAAEIDLLRSLDLVYTQVESTLEQQAEIDHELQAVRESHDSLRRFGPNETKSFLVLEEVRDQLAAEEDRLRAIEADLAATEQWLTAAKATFDEAEASRRQAQEAWDDAGAEEGADAAGRDVLARELRLAKLSSTISQENVELLQLEVKLKGSRRDLATARRALLEDKAERLGKQVKFTERDRKARLSDLAKYAAEFRARQREAEKQIVQFTAAQAKAEAEMRAAKAGDELLAAVREAYQVAKSGQREQIGMLTQRIGELARLSHFVNCRFEMVNGRATPADIHDWREQLEEMLALLKQAEHSLSLRLEEIRVDQASLYRRVHEGGAEDAAYRRWLDLKAGQLDQLADLAETSLLHLKSSARWLSRFDDDVETAIRQREGSSFLAALGAWLTAAWNHELAHVGDNSITLGKVVSAVCYVLLGVGLARLISRLLGRHLLPRLGLNEGAAHATQAIVFYLLSVVFSLLALEVVNLPLAALTFLGGAAAIGIGFGSQNILNNFFSGLILLAEQPIRVGDLVQIDGVAGTVERIGARSTVIKTMANYEIVVPNSSLLENKVTNLTLSDDLVRSAIGVTLSPVLPIEEVRRRLFEAAMSHPKVLSDPAPLVLLMSFSDTALQFELHFWLNMRSVVESRIVESDIREVIQTSLRHTGVATSAVVPAAGAKPPLAASPGALNAAPLGPTPLSPAAGGSPVAAAPLAPATPAASALLVTPMPAGKDASPRPALRSAG